MRCDASERDKLNEAAKRPRPPARRRSAGKVALTCVSSSARFCALPASTSAGPMPGTSSGSGSVISTISALSGSGSGSGFSIMAQQAGTEDGRRPAVRSDPQRRCTAPQPRRRRRRRQQQQPHYVTPRRGACRTQQRHTFRLSSRSGEGGGGGGFLEAAGRELEGRAGRGPAHTRAHSPARHRARGLRRTNLFFKKY
eukprot:SAG31_NODE_7936_length_1560_cov_2.484600_3_plen_197_part_00